MGKGKLAGLMLVMMILSQVLGFCLASGEDKQSRWMKSMFSGGASSSMNRLGSSILFPVHGNVYPIGYYNVTINVGRPSRPYFLDLDTGSDLTWLQCDAPCINCTPAPHPLYIPSNELVPCNDPLCVALHPPGQHRCETPRQCDYQVEYADGGSSLGVLVRDYFSFNYTNGARFAPHLALGCGYDQLPGAANHPLDGILGLGRGKSSILSQLSSQNYVRNVLGHCLSGRGGGYLFFGHDLYDSSHVIWTPMSREHTKHYSPGLGELHFAGKSTGLRNLEVIFDSGSSYTYLNHMAYQTLTSMITKELSGKPLVEAREDRTLPLCWRGRKPFKSVRDVKKYFKTIALSFGRGRNKALFDITPEGFLITSKRGNVCLGILNGSEVGLQDLNLIGDISMQDRMMIYDNEKQMIGWISSNCDRPPKSKIMSY